MNAQDVDPLTRNGTFYRPDDGFGTIACGCIILIAGGVWALNVHERGGFIFWYTAAWFAAIVVTSIWIGLYRRSVYRAVDGRWPTLPQGVVEPAEPLRFLSGKTRENPRAVAVTREPLFPLVVGFGLAVEGVLLSIASAGWHNGTFVAATCSGALFVAVGGFFVVTALIRLRWMAKYKRVVGHSPW